MNCLRYWARYVRKGEVKSGDIKNGYKSAPWILQLDSPFKIITIIIVFAPTLFLVICDTFICKIYVWGLSSLDPRPRAALSPSSVSSKSVPCEFGWPSALFNFCTTFAPDLNILCWPV